MTAASLLRTGLAHVLDATGVVFLMVLGWQAMLGGSHPFESYVLWAGAIGALACWMATGADKNMPPSLLAYVGVALLSSAVHQWTAVATAPERAWLELFTPAVHLVTMVLFVFGTAHCLRTPRRVSWFAVLLVASIGILAVQILFDRASSAFAYDRVGSTSLPSVAQWGGLHQTGMLLALALPFPLSLAIAARSVQHVIAGLLLVSALVVVGLANGSAGTIVAMMFACVGMATVAVIRRLRSRTIRLGLAAAAAAVIVGVAVAVAAGRIPIVAKGDLAARLPIWRAAATVMIDHPWLGAGPGRYPVAMLDGGYAARYIPKDSAGAEQAHNMLLHVGAELGITGMLCFLAVWLWMFAACWQASNTGPIPMVALGLLFTLATFFVRSMSDSFLDGLVTVDRTRVLVWMLWGAGLAMGRWVRPAHDDIAA